MAATDQPTTPTDITIATPVIALTVPPHLHPRWRDLPALTWLTVRRLGTPVQAVPVLGPLTAGCAVPFMLCELGRYHANHRLAAHHRRAVIWWRPLTATGRTTPTPRSLLLAGTLVPLFLVAALALIDVFGWAADPVLFAVDVLGLAAIAGPGNWPWRREDSRPRLQQLAQRVDVPLIMIAGLAADPTHQDTLPLLRTLRRHADQAGVGLVAHARDGNPLTGYHANGFAPADPSDADQARLLYRAPGASPYKPPATP